MQTVADPSALRAIVRGWHALGHSVALVPTMGNLHAGHFALLKQARSRCDRVVASIFVNPTQFGPGEDFATYPRSLAQDQAGLADLGCDVAFTPEVDTMYPFGIENATRVHVPQITEILEGAHRPGHFDGVTTVVSKLFHLVQPDMAVFGRKDYQQLKVIERMTRDLGLPINIVGAETQREDDGLALSSRNQYLSADERRTAAQIHVTLQQMRELLATGKDRSMIEQASASRLRRLGFEPDYVAIRRAADLAEPDTGEGEHLVGLIAARLGRTRLIDNLALS